MKNSTVVKLSGVTAPAKTSLMITSRLAGVKDAATSRASSTRIFTRGLRGMSNHCRDSFASSPSSSTTVFRESGKTSAKYRAMVQAPPPRWVSRRGFRNPPLSCACTAEAIHRMYSKASSLGAPISIWELGTPLILISQPDPE